MEKFKKTSYILFLFLMLCLRPAFAEDWHGGHEGGGHWGGGGSHREHFEGGRHFEHEHFHRGFNSGVSFEFGFPTSYYDYGYPYAYPYYDPAPYYYPAQYVIPQAVTSSAQEDSFVVNVANDRGGYTAVTIRRSGNGFIGPQGEYYTQFPNVSQLKVMYGK